jgi:four helix bundle protein
MLGDPGHHGSGRPSGSGARRHTDLEVWQDADHLRREVSRLLNQPEFGQHAWLQTQLRRSTQSACLSLSDGFSRTPREFIRFVQSARTALAEVRDLLNESARLKLIVGTRAAGLSSLADGALRAAGTLIRELERTK